MSVTYVIRFDVVPEKLNQFMQILGGVLDAMRTEPNFHEAILHRDTECAHRLMLYETWESHEDVLAVQLHRPYRRMFHDSLPEMLLMPRDMTMWQSIRADRRSRP